MKTTTLLGSIGSLTLVLVAGCGSGLKCADGTFKKGEQCVAYDPNDETPPVTTMDPPGGKSRLKTPTFATLTTNEPAEIHFTTDGSEPTLDGDGHPSPAIVTNLVEGDTVKFFAVDLARNVEATHTRTFVYDPNPPARVDLNLALVGSDAQLTWTNPTDPDFQGTVLARVNGLLDAQPVPDQFYTAGMVLSSNVEIVQVGTQTNFTDPAVGPGDVRYVAWTFDDIANYSAPDSARAQLIGTTAGTVSINVTTSTVTTPSQPPYLKLSGNSSWLAGTLTVNLTVENLTNHYFQSPKILVTSVTPGTFSNSDGAINGMGTKYYGPNHLSPGNVVTRTLTFTGVLVTDVVTLNVSVIEHPFLLAGDLRTNPSTASFNDSRFGGALGTGTYSNGSTDGNGGSRGMARPACASSDGRYLYMSFQHRGAIDRFDMSIRTPAGSVVNFPSDARRHGNVLCDGDSDGLYLLVQEGGKRQNGFFENNLLIKYAPDLTEIARVQFGATRNRGQHTGSISPGGRYVAATFSDEIVFIDTLTMQVIDTDPSTPELNPLATGVTGNGRGIRESDWSADGKTLFVNGAYERGVTRILMPFGPAGGDFTVDRFGATCCPRGGDVEVGPDGRVWAVSDSGLEMFDPDTEVLTTMPYGMGGKGLEFIDGELYVERNNYVTVDVVDTAGNIVPGRTINLPTANRHHGLRSTRTE